MGSEMFSFRVIAKRHFKFWFGSPCRNRSMSNGPKLNNHRVDHSIGVLKSGWQNMPLSLWRISEVWRSRWNWSLTFLGFHWSILSLRPFVESGYFNAQPTYKRICIYTHQSRSNQRTIISFFIDLFIFHHNELNQPAFSSGSLLQILQCAIQQNTNFNF